jgi:hypothetical protein
MMVDVMGFTLTNGPAVIYRAFGLHSSLRSRSDGQIEWAA